LSLLLNTGISSIRRAFPVAGVLLTWQPSSQVSGTSNKNLQTFAGTLDGPEKKIKNGVYPTGLQM
jgi:hypothetical protein